MATTNPVFQVLVTAGNASVLAAGSRVDSLVSGQVGVFNYHTGLSVDGTVLADAQDIFIAVGVNRSSASGSVIEDIVKSAGQVIQVRNTKAFTAKEYMPAKGKIVDITGFVAGCSTDYGIKIEFRNGKSYGINGYNQFTKSFNYTTACCTNDCSACPDGDANELAVGLVNEVNLDDDKLVTASLVATTITATVATEPTAAGTLGFTVGTTAYTAAIVDADTVTTAAAKIVAAINTATDTPYKATNTLGVITIHPVKSGAAGTFAITAAVAGLTVTPIAVTAVTVTDVAAFKAAYPNATLGIRLTSNVTAQESFTGGINIQYEKVRGTDIIVSATTGFACNGAISTAQELQYEDGIGYDIRQLEYIAGGWNGKPGPYRQSAVTGLARQGFEYFASSSAKYSVLHLTYDQMSVGGWLEYLNNLQTIFAIPCADGTTLTSLVTVLDRIFAGRFGALADDVSAFDCTSSAPVNTLTPATDGIETLS